MKKIKLTKVLFAAMLPLMLAGGLVMTGRQNGAKALNYSLEENQVLAAVTAETAQGTCCDGGGLCIIGDVVVAYAYKKANDGKPCP